MRFGVQIPQEGSDPAAVITHARAAESLGYDSVFIPDHLRAVAVPPGSECFEAWTLVTGVLCATTRLHGGPLVLSEAFRNPALLANAAATLHRMSEGRLMLGMGAGWYEDEYRDYGFAWGSGAERVARLDEALEIIRRTWAREGAGFDGRFYRARGTTDAPGAPHPPIWVGGQGPALLRVVATKADAWNAPVLTPEQVAERAEVLRVLCRDAGRPMVEISYEGPVWIDEDGERVEARLARNRASENPIARTYARCAVAGTPVNVITRVREYAAAGVTHFVAHFGKADDLRGTELFARAVMPAFARAPFAHAGAPPTPAPFAPAGAPPTPAPRAAPAPALPAPTAPASA